MISPSPFARFFQRIAPDVAADVSPLLEKTLAAWAEGHAFIWLDEAEIRLARSAYPLVAENHAAPLVLAHKRLFLGKVWAMERACGQRLTNLARAKAPCADDLAPFFSRYFPDVASREQAQAAALALLHRFLLISGGPGTGKTTTVAKILALLCHGQQPLPRIALTAPTGKAAAHLQQSLVRTLATFSAPEPVRAHLSELSGQTLHRLLGIRPPLLASGYGQDNPLPYDVVVADEASMIDLAMLDKLTAAVGSGSRLILLGDEDQLPSVGAGAVLSALARETVLSADDAAQVAVWLPTHDLPQADVPPSLSAAVARLTVSRRFDANSGIGRLAESVAQHHPDSLACFAYFPQQLTMMARTKNLFNTWYGVQGAYWQAVRDNDVCAVFAHFYDGIMLSVLRRDAEAFNRGYVQFLQQQGHGDGYFCGRAVIMTRNNPALEVYNGDIGIVLNTTEGRPAVFFPEGNGFRHLDVGRLSAHENAFALTVHKSQGSEYREVCLLAPVGEAPELFDRSLLYTAITRAKERFVYLGNADSFTTAVGHHHLRRSALGTFFGDSSAAS